MCFPWRFATTNRSLPKALVLSKQLEQGRKVLQELRELPDVGHHAMAWATTALSYALDDQPLRALDCCQAVQGCPQALDLAGFLEALCRFRLDEPEAPELAARREKRWLKRALHGLIGWVTGLYRRMTPIEIL